MFVPVLRLVMRVCTAVRFVPPLHQVALHTATTAFSAAAIEHAPASVSRPAAQPHTE